MQRYLDEHPVVACAAFKAELELMFAEIVDRNKGSTFWRP